MSIVANKKIIVIEDDKAIREFLRTYLGAQHFDLVEAETAVEGIGYIQKQLPDLLLLDLGLPDQDGLEVIKQLRTWTQLPIIVISARGNDRDKVLALDLGADDYLTKPFSVTELMARIRVALRHRAIPIAESPTITIGALTIDFATQQVYKDDEVIKLSPTEFAILKLLAQNWGKVVTNEKLLSEVWGNKGEPEYLRIYLHQLRRKLEAEPARPEYLHTRTGVGYQLWFMPSETRNPN